MEWRSQLTWEDESDDKLVILLVNGAIVSFIDHVWALEAIISVLVKKVGIRTSFDCLTRLHSLLFDTDEHGFV